MLETSISAVGSHAELVKAEATLEHVIGQIRFDDRFSPLVVDLLTALEATALRVEIAVSADRETRPDHLLELIENYRYGHKFATMRQAQNVALFKAWEDKQWEYLECEATITLTYRGEEVGARRCVTGIEWSSFGDLLWNDPNYDYYVETSIADPVAEALRDAVLCLAQSSEPQVFDALVTAMSVVADEAELIDEEPFGPWSIQ